MLSIIYHLVMYLNNVYMILCDCIPELHLHSSDTVGYGRFFGVFLFIHDAFG